jgi:hypothetical protein
VSFRWRDRAKENRVRTMRLVATDFVRRFLQHVLPRGFVRIRHYGLLSNRAQLSLERSRTVLAVPLTSRPHPSKGNPQEDWASAFERIFGTDPLLCPQCGQGRLVIGAPFPARPHDPHETSPARAPP